MSNLSSGARHIGLTGGIGSGKSTVASMLVGLGATVVDADALSRQLTAPGGAAMPAIRRIFGPQFMSADGALDRARMRELVFTQADAKSRLEAIVHPLVAQASAQAVADAEAAGATCVVLDVPLLVESGRWRPWLHHVWVVDCTPERQISRVMARSAWTEDAVRRVIAGQASRAERLAAADACLFNDCLSLDELAGQVRQLASCFGL